MAPFYCFLGPDAWGKIEGGVGVGLTNETDTTDSQFCGRRKERKKDFYCPDWKGENKREQGWLVFSFFLSFRFLDCLLLLRRLISFGFEKREER